MPIPEDEYHRVQDHLLKLHGDDESPGYLAGMNAYFMQTMARDLRQWADTNEHFKGAPGLPESVHRLADAMDNPSVLARIEEVVASRSKRECETVFETCKLVSAIGFQKLAEIHAFSGLVHFDITQEKLTEDLEELSGKLEGMAQDPGCSLPSPK